MLIGQQQAVVEAVDVVAVDAQIALVTDVISQRAVVDAHLLVDVHSAKHF